MAHVDLQSGEIYGCEPESLTWWHEKGHIEYNKSGDGQRNAFAQQSTFNLTVFFTVLALFYHFFRFIAFIMLLTTISFGVFEEVWCWVYAVKRKRERKRKNL